jgi:hypothetical protein
LQDLKLDLAKSIDYFTFPDIVSLDGLYTISAADSGEAIKSVRNNEKIPDYIQQVSMLPPENEFNPCQPRSRVPVNSIEVAV